jgi:hypothetical protein
LSNAHLISTKTKLSTIHNPPYSHLLQANCPTSSVHGPRTLIQLTFQLGLHHPQSVNYLLLGRCALLPLHVHDLGELEISRVGGEQTSSAGVGAGQADLRVDVEHAVCAAGGPDNRGAVSLVVLEVVAVDGAVEFVFGAGLVVA